MAKTFKDTAAIMGRIGPASNLRPAGSHKSLRFESRAKIRQELRRGDWD